MPIPFERITVGGAEALAAADALRAEGRGWPLIVGDDGRLALLEQSILGARPDTRAPEGILAAASGLDHPGALLARNQALNARAAATLAALRPPEPLRSARGVAGLLGGVLARLSSARPRPAPPPAPEPAVEPEERETGEWPDHDPGPPGRGAEALPSLASRLVQRGDRFVQEPLARVHILLIPADEGASVPAHLRWGGWNACPPPEYHVAALRAWQGRYGAELIGLGPDVMELRTARRPATREAALALAREHDAYGAEIDGPLAPYAAELMANPWWFFWWD